LRLLEGIDELAHARPASARFEQATRHAQATAISQSGERALWGGRRSWRQYIHIFQYMNVWAVVKSAEST
jgi:hypothetical protein